jgi:hypothetical protein
MLVSPDLSSSMHSRRPLLSAHCYPPLLPASSCWPPMTEGGGNRGEGTGNAGPGMLNAF